LKVNRRARRVSLRLDRTKGDRRHPPPSQRRLTEAAAFARERASWIAERLAELPETAPLAPGMVIEVFGVPVRLEQGAGRARWIEPAGRLDARIAAWARTRASPAR
jgi:predicted metal-dependent hydrolase